MTWLTITLYTIAGLVAIPVLPTVTFILVQFRRTYRVPSNLPWAGLKDKWLFARTRASMREFAAKRDPIQEGYEKYSKHGQAFVLPTMHWPDVALPPSNNAWLISQPDSVLSTIKTQDDLLIMDHLGHGPDQAAVHDFSVITRDLTRQMGRLLTDLMDELVNCFEKEFGCDDKEWKEVGLYETIELASRRGANRMFIGLPLCRNEKAMEILFSSGILFALCGAILRSIVPSFLKGLLAPIVGLPFFYQRWRLKRILLPTITQRMRLVQQQLPKTEQPNDGLQWIINSAYRRETNTFTLQPSHIAGKTQLLNFFAVFTTSITAGTVLLDILTHSPSTPTAPTSPSNADLLSQLREEAAAILPLLATDPTAVRRMHKLDSVIRETLRCNPMFGRGIQREVVRPGGVTTPDGVYLPKGTHVCAVIAPMQRDSTLSNTPDADTYQPLRFSSPPSPDNTESKRLGAVQISETFLSFSLGKHACPGRFFAVQTLKVMIGWLLLHYDFEVVLEEGKTEVEYLEVGEARLPPQNGKGKVRVRRRRVEGEVVGEEREGTYSDELGEVEKV